MPWLPLWRKPRVSCLTQVSLGSSGLPPPSSLARGLKGRKAPARGPECPVPAHCGEGRSLGAGRERRLPGQGEVGPRWGTLAVTSYTEAPGGIWVRRRVIFSGPSLSFQDDILQGTDGDPWRAPLSLHRERGQCDPGDVWGPWE